jgi:hypothetical protein
MSIGGVVFVMFVPVFVTVYMRPMCGFLAVVVLPEEALR